jgi:hypothetical protein
MFRFAQHDTPGNEMNFKSPIILCCLFCDVFHLESSAADTQIALRIWDLDAGCGDML